MLRLILYERTCNCSLKTDLRFAALKFAGGIERRNVGLRKMLSKVHVSRPSGGRQS